MVQGESKTLICLTIGNPDDNDGDDDDDDGDDNDGDDNDGDDDDGGDSGGITITIVKMMVMTVLLKKQVRCTNSALQIVPSCALHNF